MKTLLVGQTDIVGGAARAAYRLHRALLQFGVESRMKVRWKVSDDWTVNGPTTLTDKAMSLLRPTLSKMITGLKKPTTPGEYSCNLLPSCWAAAINASPAEIVNLHWVGSETLSIEDIGRIRKPLVWTLHDMWPFCGTEHYTGDDSKARWRIGYKKMKRKSASGMDIDRFTWLRKRRCWLNPMHIVAPSSWLADCARHSALFRDRSVYVIPNVLDTEVYRPLKKNLCREALGLPADGKIILFGAMGGGRDQRKGHDLLIESLARLVLLPMACTPMCVIFGQTEPRRPIALPFPVRWMGRLHDDAALVLLYNAADVMIVPSIQENLPQTATEAQACGCPVVAFETTGFADTVEHRETGYLAKAYQVEDMAEGLRWILEDEKAREAVSRAARERALRLWAPEKVVPQYLELYRCVAGRKSGNIPC